MCTNESTVFSVYKTPFSFTLKFDIKNQPYTLKRWIKQYPKEIYPALSIFAYTKKNRLFEKEIFVQTSRVFIKNEKKNKEKSW